jgi:hypothetical protein
MIRLVLAASAAAMLMASPGIARAQDMVGYGDTMRKHSHTQSAVHPVKRGAAPAKHSGKSTAHAAKKARSRK